MGTRLRDFRFAYLPLGLRFFPRCGDILAVTRVRFYSAYLCPFTASEVVRAAIALRVFVDATMIANALRMVLRVLITCYRRVNVGVSREDNAFCRFVDRHRVSFLWHRFGRLDFSVMCDQIVLGFQGRAVALIRTCLY